ncbi:hypothetical protein Tcan_18728 [Toxocara canis]|uniref:Uncharacterized protein n=2 Tax=Toxocara canis TaxID=6265 RepID=A0A0B2W4L7_TOXCA|nr:hypothetical protein Tcan_18728 [Toxocara canis]VDM42437.1 unnamed protein product [Toxocara canis]
MDELQPTASESFIVIEADMPKFRFDKRLVKLFWAREELHTGKGCNATVVQGQKAAKPTRASRRTASVVQPGAGEHLCDSHMHLVGFAFGERFVEEVAAYVSDCMNYRLKGEICNGHLVQVNARRGYHTHC